MYCWYRSHQFAVQFFLCRWCFISIGPKAITNYGVNARRIAHQKHNTHAIMPKSMCIASRGWCLVSACSHKFGSTTHTHTQTSPCRFLCQCGCHHEKLGMKQKCVHHDEGECIIILVIERNGWSNWWVKISGNVRSPLVPHTHSTKAIFSSQPNPHLPPTEEAHVRRLLHRLWTTMFPRVYTHLESRTWWYRWGEKNKQLAEMHIVRIREVKRTRKRRQFVSNHNDK